MKTTLTDKVRATYFLEGDYKNLFIPQFSLAFIINPKAGGTSLKKYAHELYKHKEKQSDNLLTNCPSLPENLIKASNQIYKAYVVRNPWDRLVSCYVQKREYDRKRFYRMNRIDSNISFKDFVHFVCGTPDYKSDHHFRSQFTKIINPDGQIIVDCIMRFSRLQDDFLDLRLAKNLPEINLPHLNKTNRTHYTEYYTDDLIKLVEERYRVDVEMFNFEYAKVKDAKIQLPVMHKLSLSNQIEIFKYIGQRAEWRLAYLNQNFVPKPNSIRDKVKYFLGVNSKKELLRKFRIH